MGTEPVHFEAFRGVAGYRTAISSSDPNDASLKFRAVPIASLLGRRARWQEVWQLLVDVPADGWEREEDLIEAAVRAPMDLTDPMHDLQQTLLRFAAATGERAALDRSPSELAQDAARLSVLFHRRLGLLLAHHRGGAAPAPAARGQFDGAPNILGQSPSVTADDDALLNALLVLLAENGSSASTLTARVVLSTGASASAAFVAALSAMSGPKHGGAMARVHEALSEMHATATTPASWVTSALDRREILPGVGHRVYRVEDPRTIHLRQFCGELNATWYDLAATYQTVAPELLAARKGLPPSGTNIDLWVAVALEALSIPRPLLTAFMAAGRLAGWSAHLLEQHAFGKILRPADLPARTQ